MRQSKIAAVLACFLWLSGCTVDDDAPDDQSSAQAVRDAGPNNQRGDAAPARTDAPAEDPNDEPANRPGAAPVDRPDVDGGAAGSPGTMSDSTADEAAAGAGGSKARGKRPKQPKAAGAPAEAGKAPPQERGKMRRSNGPGAMPAPAAAGSEAAPP